MVGKHPDGKTPPARAEHLLPPAAAPALPQAGAQPLGVPCRATGWRRRSAPLPRRGFLLGKALLCQRPTLAQKPGLPCASSHGPMAAVPRSSHPPPRRGQARRPCVVMPQERRQLPPVEFSRLLAHHRSAVLICLKAMVESLIIY